jgi:hypothetical protein
MINYENIVWDVYFGLYKLQLETHSMFQYLTLSYVELTYMTVTIVLETLLFELHVM